MEFGPSHATHLHVTVRLADPNPGEEEPLLTKIIREKDKKKMGFREMSPASFTKAYYKYLFGFSSANKA